MEFWILKRKYGKTFLVVVGCDSKALALSLATKLSGIKPLVELTQGRGLLRQALGEACSLAVRLVCCDFVDVQVSGLFVP